MIQLKSPTSPNGKLANDVTPTRRRSADVADTPQYYTEHERVSHVNSTNNQSERVNSTILTPTATSFSKDELNEIFNISRDSMDVERITGLESSSSVAMQQNTSTNMASSPSDKPHNIALNESNFSMDSTVMESSCISQTETDLHSSRCSSDDNNNMKNSSVVTPDKTDIRQTDSPVGSNVNKLNTDTSSPANKAGSLSKLQMVCREIFMTEKSYVNDLQDIIEVGLFLCKKMCTICGLEVYGLI